MNRDRQWTKGLILNGLITLLLMIMIFGFSAGTADESSVLSLKVTEWLMGLIYPEYSALSADQQYGVFSMLHMLVRKLAHFGEYALLGAALRQFLWTFPLRWPGTAAWIMATLYAVLDEWHQTFVSGRSGQLRDICIDSAGALAGVFLAAAATALIMEKLRKRPKEDTKSA